MLGQAGRAKTLLPGVFRVGSWTQAAKLLEHLQAYSTQAERPRPDQRRKRQASEESTANEGGSAADVPQLSPRTPQQAEADLATVPVLRSSRTLRSIQDSAQLGTQVEANGAPPASSEGTGRYGLARQAPSPAFLGNRKPPTDVLEAIREVQARAKAKFDETVEIAMHLGTDPRKGEQQVRGAVVLPHGTGKPLRVCVFTEGEGLELAKQAGADLVGSDDIIAAVQEGKIEFDKCLATADVMPRLSRVARVLGPRGLMPNPKLGTLIDTSSMAAAIRQMKGGRVEYRADRTANVHAGIGKVSFPPEQLYRNLSAFVAAILKARPKGVKGSAQSYILSAYLSSTMGSSVPVTLPSVLVAAQGTKK